jgi:tetratricopeptide (TPR) repeat protein
LVWGVLLVLASLLVYSQTVDFGFVGLDDTAYVTENARVQAGLNIPNLAWSFSTFYIANWTPLTWLSLMLDTDLYGVRAGGYHLTNILLHAANTWLLFLVLARATQNRVRSAFVAALFALHPLHVESVAWISERKDVLSTLFGLFALLSYVTYATQDRKLSLVASFFFFVCSLLSKQTLVTLPFVFLLLDYWPLRRIAWPGSAGRGDAAPTRAPYESTEPNGRRDDDSAASIRKFSIGRLLAEKLPFFAASAAFSVMSVIAQSRGGAVRSFVVLPLASRCRNALVVYLAYLWQTVCPLNLAAFYPHPAEKLTWIAAGAAAALLLAISVFALVRARRSPFLLVGWCWYLGTLVPMIGIVQVGTQQRADRYTYFPLIGLFVAVTWLIPQLVRADAIRNRVLPCVACASLAVLTVMTFEQVSYWRDSVLLFRHSLECTNDNPETRFRLGTALIKQGQTSEGIDNLEVAVRMAPDDAMSQYNLANGLQIAGRLEEAVPHYEAALAIDDELADVHNNLGVTLMALRKYPDAKRHFSRVLELRENNLRAYVNLGDVCVKSGEYNQAIAYSRRALALDPKSLNAHQCIAIALRGLGRIDEAIARLRELAAGAPDNEEVREELARTLAMKHGSTAD